MVEYRRRLVVPVPLGDAFAYLSRFSNAAEWDPGVSRAHMVTPDPVGLGSIFHLDAVFMRNTVPLRYEIIEFDPPNRVMLVAENASVRSADTISFSPDPAAGTVVQYTAELALKGLARLATPLFALALRRLGERASAGLLATLTAANARPKGGQP